MAARLSWPGAGTTSTVSSLATLASAVAAASPGDTIQLADGTYNFQAFGADISHAKSIRIKAVNPLGAVIVGSGGSAPTTANQEMSPAHRVFGLRTNGASGAWFEDLYIKYMGVGIDIDNSNDVVIQGCKFESCYDAGVQIFDAARPQVHMCEFRDPYFSADTAATLTAAGSVTDAQMDYGVALWGTDQARVTHNYFHGVFNQACSFKEGNRSAYAGFNVFEGFNLTALFIGQNKPGNGPYEHSGLPLGPDIGDILVEFNVFRPVQAGAKTYRANSAIRVWHTNGNVHLNANVIEAAVVAISIEGREGSEVGYAAGGVVMTDNLVGGTWKNIAGALTDVSANGIRLYKGVPALIEIARTTYVGCDKPFAPCFDDGGIENGLYPNYIESGTKTVGFDYSAGLTGGSAPNLTLKTATVALDPDLSYTGLRTSPVYNLSSPINEDADPVQTMFTDARTTINGGLTGASVGPRAITDRELAPNSVDGQALHWLLARRLGVQKPGGSYSARRNSSRLTNVAIAANPTVTTLVTHTYTAESAREVLWITAEIGQPSLAQVYNVKLTLDGANIVPTDTVSLSGASYRAIREAGWTDTAAGEGKQMLIVPLTQQFHTYQLRITVAPTGGSATMGFVRLWSYMTDVEF